MRSHPRSTPTVYINGRFLRQKVTGVQRYARETLAALDELLGLPDHQGTRWVVLAPLGTEAPHLRHIGFRATGRLDGHLWEQTELAWASRDGILWSFTATGPLLRRRQVITVHDAAVLRMPEVYGHKFRLWYSTLIRQLGRRIPQVMTVSHFSAVDIADGFGISPRKITVTHGGWQHVQRHAAGRPTQPPVADYVLAVSSPTPNKNFAALLEALALLGDDAPSCLIVGSAERSIYQHAVCDSPKVRFTGYVSDSELSNLYRHAYCFVFPSFYEGFGLPPLEAMAHGCPVLASTAPAIGEVCGTDGALYFDPHRPGELAEHLRSIYQDPSLRQSLVEAGRRRLERFSWRSAAGAHLAAAQRLLGAKQALPASSAP